MILARKMEQIDILILTSAYRNFEQVKISSGMLSAKNLTRHCEKRGDDLRERNDLSRLSQEAIFNEFVIARSEEVSVQARRSNPMA
jgi:hypothetical protein